MFMKKRLIYTTLLMGSIALAAAPMEGAYVHPKCKAMIQKKIKKAKMKSAHSPFLIAQGLPHLTKKIKMMWDDPKLNLSDEQKSELLKVRQETIATIKKLKPQIMQLQQEIVQGSRAGESAEMLADKVKKLGTLKAEATITQLQCLEKTKAILSKDQLFYVMSKKKKKMMKQETVMTPKMKTAPGAMKCAAGKCGSAK
jgi:hypothetical protein